MGRQSNTVVSCKISSKNSVGLGWCYMTQCNWAICDAFLRQRNNLFRFCAALHLLALHLAPCPAPASPAALSHMECARKARASDAWLHKHCLSDTNTALNTSITILSLHTSTMNVNHVCHERCFQHSLGQDNIVSLDSAHNENEWKHESVVGLTFYISQMRFKL